MVCAGDDRGEKVWSMTTPPNLTSTSATTCPNAPAQRLSLSGPLSRAVGGIRGDKQDRRSNVIPDGLP
jgi:hypothetical protein